MADGEYGNFVANLFTRLVNNHHELVAILIELGLVILALEKRVSQFCEFMV